MKQAADFSQLVVEGACLDADEMSEMMGRVYSKTRIEPLKGVGPIRMSAAHGTLPGVRLGRMEIASGMRALQLDAHEAIGFAVPFSGQLETQGTQGVFEASAGAAIAFDLTVCEVVRCSPNYGNHSVGIDRTLLARRLTYLLGRSMPQAIAFAPQIDTRSSRGAALASLLACVADPNFGQVLRNSPFTAAHIPTLMVDFLLENWPHTYSAEFRREPPGIAPRAVKTAIDFIEAHPMTAASSEELARHCGVSLRALQYGFRRFAGASIGEYQRRVRLQHARSDLLACPDPVDVVAQRWGFSNAGRFSRYFKAAFGISPSALRRY